MFIKIPKARRINGFRIKKVLSKTKIKLTLKVFLVKSTANVPDIGQIHLVILSIICSVRQRSVRHVGSNVAFELYLGKKN